VDEAFPEDPDCFLIKRLLIVQMYGARSVGVAFSCEPSCIRIADSFGGVGFSGVQPPNVAFLQLDL
jgi:hypothetical protein